MTFLPPNKFAQFFGIIKLSLNKDSIIPKQTNFTRVQLNYT